MLNFVAKRLAICLFVALVSTLAWAESPPAKNTKDIEIAKLKQRIETLTYENQNQKLELERYKLWWKQQTDRADGLEARFYKANALVAETQRNAKLNAEQTVTADEFFLIAFTVGGMVWGLLALQGMSR